MKKFFFRLETLLKIRNARERRMQKELNFQLHRHAQQTEKKETLEKQIGGLLDEIRMKRQEKNRRLQEAYEQILEHLNFSLSQVELSLATQGKQIEGMQEQLKQAVLERKVIEKIKEKHYSGWRSDLQNADDNLTDEFAGRH